jgi:hypothetical protein
MANLKSYGMSKDIRSICISKDNLDNSSETSCPMITTKNYINSGEVAKEAGSTMLQF